MPSTPTYLVTAASGTIGKRLIPILLASPSRPHIVLPTSNISKLEASLPDGLDKARIDIVEGSIQDPNFVESTLREHKITAVSLALTGQDELFTTMNLLDVMQRSETVKHIVYISACGDYSLDAIKSGSLLGQSAAHVIVKYIVEAKIRHGLPRRNTPGGLSWTILGPSLFFDNDLMTKQHMIEQGLFTIPLGEKGISRVDPKDVALAVANALYDDGQHWDGKKVDIGELQTYTASENARLWSEALRKEIKPTLSDKAGLDGLEEGFGQIAGPGWGRGLRLMYETFAEKGFSMTEAQYEEQIALLGKEPETYRDFVFASSAQWSKE